MNFSKCLMSTFTIFLLIFSPSRLQGGIIDFEDLPLNQNDTAIAEEFSSGGATFIGETVFDCCWSGWIYSYSMINQDLSISPGEVDSSNPLSDVHRSTAYAPPEGAVSNYVVSSFVDSLIEPDSGRTGNNTPILLPPGETIASIEIANTTWTAHSMLVGDAFSGPFSEDDFFRLTITGFDDEHLVGSVDVSLAEGRDVVDDWLFVSLGELSGANRLEFSLASSDSVSFGDTSYLNTPTFFAVDDIVTTPVPEPGSISLLVLGVGCLFGRKLFQILCSKGSCDE